MAESNKLDQEQLGEYLLEAHRLNPEYSLAEVADILAGKKWAEKFYYPDHNSER